MHIYTHKNTYKLLINDLLSELILNGGIVGIDNILHERKA